MNVHNAADDSSNAKKESNTHQGKETDPSLQAKSRANRTARRNRRRGFTPPRRGRPSGTISGGSR